MAAQLTADCTMVRWSWTRYLLVHEMVSVDFCTDNVNAKPTPSAPTTPEARQPGVPARSSSCRGSERSAPRPRASLWTKLLDPGSVQRSFVIRYGAAEGPTSRLLVCTCDDVATARNFVLGLRALLWAVPLMQQSRLPQEQLDFVQQAFRASDEGRGYVAVRSTAVHRLLARLNISAESELCRRAQAAPHPSARAHPVKLCCSAQHVAPPRRRASSARSS